MPRQLKTNFNKNLNCYVVYEIKMNEGGSFHVGLTDRQLPIEQEKIKMRIHSLVDTLLKVVTHTSSFKMLDKFCTVELDFR